jgi:ATP dependent DNA ligase C terminal region
MTVRVETAEATQRNARIDGDGRPSVIQPLTWKLYTNTLLIVSYYRGKDLVYVARVRNGFVPASRRQVFEKIRHLVSPTMPFANLPDTHKARWGDELTAEKMEECAWLRPEAVAHIKIPGNGRKQIGSGIRNSWGCERVKTRVKL